jgi:hypothetical protein
MTSSSEAFDIQDFVYEGLWENYSEHPLKRWTWTLSDSNALLCLACLTALIAFAQTRAWVIIRYFIYKRTKSPTLPGDHNADPRQNLSQGMAIAEALPSIKTSAKKLRDKLRRTPIQQVYDCPIVSPWFGILALVNVSVFVVVSVVAPWGLSSGSLKTPIVKSKSTDACLTSYKHELVGDLLNKLDKTDAIFQQCRNRLDDTCNKQFYLRQPQVHKQRIKTCPFPVNICHNGTMPVEMTHSNIDAYEVGVNSKTRLNMNHRLTCAPINLDFLTLYSHTDSSPPKPLKAFITVQAGSNLTKHFAMALRTLNGPNPASGENSGRLMAEANIPSDLTVLPRYFADVQTELMHPSLRRSDAMPFLVIYRAGAVKNVSPVEDPFFSANNMQLNDNKTFYADHEATALGCIEQFQFCLEGSVGCTDWGQRSTPINGLAKLLELSRDDASLFDITTLFKSLPAMFSVHDYVAVRVDLISMVPLITVEVWNRVESSQERWVTEVETWFIKGILDAILYARYGARFPLNKVSENLEPKLKKEHSLCGRILFRDGRYTNINWVGLWFMIAMLVIIYLASYLLESIDGVFVKWVGFWVMIATLVIIYFTSYLVEWTHRVVTKLCNSFTAATNKLVKHAKSVAIFTQNVWTKTKEALVYFADRVVSVWGSFSISNLVKRIRRRDQSSWRLGSRAAPAARSRQTTRSGARRNENYSL